MVTSSTHCSVAMRYLVLASVLVLVSCTLRAQIVINEFMASNDATITDEFGEFDDWVELYNTGNQSINIGGWYLTDDLTDPQVWQIPTDNPTATTIAGGDFLILWFDKQTEQGTLHVDAKLGGSGEDIGLYAADGTTLIDGFSYGPQLADVSEGRLPNGGPNFSNFNDPTPGSSNIPPTSAGLAATPVFSQIGGPQSSNVSLILTTDTPNATIYYTTDGTRPDNTSLVYNGNINISSNTPIRAIAYAPGFDPSTVSTQTYLFGLDSDFSLVTVSSAPDDFFGPDGLYENIDIDVELPMNVEMYLPNGEPAFNQRFEVEIQGSASAVYPQKSLGFKAKSSLGNDEVDYPVFDDLEFEKYRSLVVRNSGQDWGITMFRDAFVSSLVRDISDIDVGIDKPELNTQGYRPAHHFLNGEYYGIANLRERMDKRYLKVHFDLDDTEMDLIEGNDEVKEGSYDAWDDLQSFLINNSFEDDATFDELAELIDVSEYTDYVIFNTFINNHDWPGNNDRRWRALPDGQWHWMVYDLDFTFGLFTEDGWDTGIWTDNAIERMLTPNSFLWPNPNWATRLFEKATENDDFRTKFINRYADQLNTLYSPDRIDARLDEFVDIYTPEYDLHNSVWFSQFNVAEDIEKMRAFGLNRRASSYANLVESFEDATGTATLSVSTNPSNAGAIEINTITLEADNLNWQGTYFTGLDIPVKAVGERGYIFNNWSGPVADNSDNKTELDFNFNTSLVANFTQGSTSETSIVINEINYNSPDDPNAGDWVELINPNGQAVDMSGWYFEDESGDFFPIPDNTILQANEILVLVEDENDFANAYPNVTNFIGEFGDMPLGRGFKFKNSSEQLSLYNAAGTLIDVVTYNDDAPWPEAADGDGPTLQLIATNLDNTLPQSWIAQAATPGQPNNLATGPVAQTINFIGIPDKLTTDNPFSIAAIASSGLAVEFSIVSGPASVNGNVITLNGTVGTVTVQATQSGNTDYLPASPVFNIFEVTELTNPTNYCESEGEQPWLEWIGSVNVGSISNNSSKSKYSDFTDISTTVQAGSSTPFMLGVAYSFYTYDEYIRVWVDLNGDGDFNDSGETVIETMLSAPPNGTFSVIVADNLTIPANTPFGEKRMRVAMKRGSYPTPCETFTNGEVEDYTINVQNTAPPTGLTLVCAQDITVEIPFGQTSITANWAVPMAVTDCASGADIEQMGGPAIGATVTEGFYFIIYEATDDCGNMETCQFNLIVNQANGNASNYCVAEGQNPWQDWIAGVRMGSIDNDSGKSRYSDFTAQSTQVVPTGIAGINLTSGFSWKSYDEYWNVWIDYNQNGQFENNELALSEFIPKPDNGIGTFTTNHVINIPSSAQLGATRMRIAMSQDGFPPACGSFTNGEVEDYSIEITPPSGGGLAQAAILGFQAQKEGRNVGLHWIINQEFEKDYYEIEHSIDGLNFTQISSVSSKHNDHEIHHYSAYDEKPGYGVQHYRLKIFKIDGSHYYSAIETVEFNIDLAVISVFPNPANQFTHINLGAFEGSKAAISLVDQFGRTLNTRTMQLIDGPVFIPTGNLQAGIYFIHVNVESYRPFTRRVVVVH